MSERRWRTAYASVIGTSHIKTDAPCQDAGSCVVATTAEGREVLVAAASDGAGTASRSEVGAALTVAHFLRDFAQAATADHSLASIDRNFVDRWIAGVRGAIAALAAEEGKALRDYACTLLGAVIGPSAAAYVQIGDGAIVVAGEESGEYSWIAWPQHGEYANATNFVTQEGVSEILFFETGAAVKEVALFTDGIERLVLDLSAKTVHAPAFKPIFEWLARTEPDQDAQPSKVLAAYLGSDHVNRRTDDDKTLVMATRAEPPVAVP